MIYTAAEMYEHVLKELNRHGTLSVTPDEFNSSVNAVQLDYIRMRYMLFARHQKVIDDLQELIVVTDGGPNNPAMIANSGGTNPGEERFLLPNDISKESGKYLYLLKVEFVVPDTCVEGGHRRFTGYYDRHNSDNAYYSGDDKRWFYYVSDGALQRKAGRRTTKVADAVVLHYLRYPKDILVDDQGASVQDPEFSPAQNLEIAMLTSSKFMGTFTDARTSLIQQYMGLTATF